ncbi:MAG TPA: SIS domain-containing protein [bacterium]|nr:SIS domain-containing protein [bacterium]HQG44655.1 SIS domain-containing protein [bacterium]HQI49347.1 SIS domain-containing protein [bacterium]HQJ63711.1 SIS domain-containing protein [bacterium]
MDLTQFQDGHTFKEIMRQPEIWREAMADMSRRRHEMRGWLDEHQQRVWIFTGCGTSYYLSQTGAALFELVTGLRTRAVPASEILIYPQLVFNRHEQPLLVAISRSGTTTETLRAVKKARSKYGVPVLSVSCDAASPLMREGDLRLTFPFPAERSVVMTGSFTTMLLGILYLGLQAAGQEQRLALLELIPEACAALIADSQSRIAAVADRPSSDFVFLAQGPYLGLANEASLKMKEMSISPSVCYHALEFRHGPMSVVSEETLITVLLSDSGRALELRVAADMKKLGAEVALLHAAAGSLEAPFVDHNFAVPSRFGDLFNPFLYMPLLQLLGYFHARCKGIHPDRPRNLTAVVTLDDAGGLVLEESAGGHRSSGHGY